LRRSADIASKPHLWKHGASAVSLETQPNFEGTPSSDIEEINMTEVLEHLDDTNRMSSRRLGEASWDTQETVMIG
jgi:hypothetical protein